jgi:hypothetical protein
VRDTAGADRRFDEQGAHVDFNDYVAQGGYTELRECIEHRRDVETVIETDDQSSPLVGHCKARDEPNEPHSRLLAASGPRPKGIAVMRPPSAELTFRPAIRARR